MYVSRPVSISTVSTAIPAWVTFAPPTSWPPCELTVHFSCLNNDPCVILFLQASVAGSHADTAAKTDE